MTGLDVRPLGEHAVLVGCPDVDTVHRLHEHVRASRPPWLLDVVPGWDTVVVRARPGAGDELDRFAAELAGWRPPAGGAPAGPVVELPVVYDGPDLAEVAALTGLDQAAVVARHTAATYEVAFLGFTPGFPYLRGLDPALRVPRLATPRERVPAGSVGIGGDQTGVYPQTTPGGWRIVGRTTAVLFDPDRDPPALLAPGHRVRFVAAAGNG